MEFAGLEGYLYLDAGHEAQAKDARRSGGFRQAVKRVMVGQGNGRQAFRTGLPDERVRRQRAIAGGRMGMKVNHQVNILTVRRDLA